MVQDALAESLLASGPVEAGPSWLSARRHAAMAAFAELGLPTPRLEAWRFNDYRALRAALAAPPAPGVVPSAHDVARYAVPNATHRLVFVDGCFTPALSTIGSLPPGVTLTTLAEATPEVLSAAFPEHPRRCFAALNAGLAYDGLVLTVADGVTLPAPIDLLQIRTVGGPPVQLRHLVILGAGAQATIVETATSIGRGGSSSVTVMALEQGSRLDWVKLQDEDRSALHLAQMSATVAADARLNAFFLVLGAALSRQEIDIALTERNGQVMLNGSYCLAGDQEATLAPFVDHQTTNGETTELFKGVLDDNAHGIFQGSIIVREGADGTRAHQQNRNLLTSPTARVDTKPELMIHADEVKCSHGATVGDLDENSLFYLLARGIDPATARRMLIEAFLNETIERSGLDSPIQDWLHRHLDGRLRRGDAVS